ncbi:MAG TPA: hypothetical protein VNX61_12585, partial [Rhizomicrobium sp.]|nr:hypothetical protein [Rhizomicrobium sp.]
MHQVEPINAANALAFLCPSGAALLQFGGRRYSLGLGGAMSDIPVNREVWNRLIREVRSRTRGRADPEELLHSAYLRLLRYRAQHAVDNIAAFLVRTAVNIGVDNFRHERFIADVTPEDLAAAENSPLQD